MPVGIRPSRLRRGSSDASLASDSRLGQVKSRPESGGGGQVLIDAGADGLGIDVWIREELLEGRMVVLCDCLVRSFRRIVEDVAAQNDVRVLHDRGDDGEAAKVREGRELFRDVRGVGGGVTDHVVRRDHKEQAVRRINEETRHELAHVRDFRRDERGLSRQAGERPVLPDVLDGDVVGVHLRVVVELVDAYRALSQLLIDQPELGGLAVETECQRESVGEFASVRKVRVCGSVPSAEQGAYEST